MNQQFNLPCMQQAKYALGLLSAAIIFSANAENFGVTTEGSTGGLVIPSAYVLGSGSIAATAGNYPEPQLGTFSKKQNYTLGVGLLPNVELFGRIAEYQNPLPGSTYVNGPRDMSANVKVQLPGFWRNQPRVALGVNDVSGGAAFFNAKYVVLSDQYGPLRWSLGYARGNKANSAALNGGFAGAEVFLGETGAAALVEYDGHQKHIGLRYYASPIAFLGNAQWVGTVQRSSGAINPAGQKADATSIALSLVLPLGENTGRVASLKFDNVLPALDTGPASTGMVPTTADRVEKIQQSLVALGLERVRVGTWGRDVVVAYENHRYGQNEADALGLVLGVAVEHAPQGTQRIYAVTLKAGQRVYESSVGVAEYRAFLRDGDTFRVRTSLMVDRQASFKDTDVSWADASPSMHSKVRIEIKPDVNYAVASEPALFNYALAASVQAITPLWRGAELYASYLQGVSHSADVAPGQAFSNLQQRNGLRVAAIHQSLWWGSNLLTNVGAGKYKYDTLGVQGESIYFVPGRDDQIRLRAAVYQRLPGQTVQQTYVNSGSYRYVYSPNTWVEAGMQHYSDGSSGPFFAFTRWFDDVSIQVFYRRGATAQFAGLELSIPLTPRQGMAPGLFQVGGASQFARGLRTRITDSGTSANWIIPDAVRDIQLDYNLQVNELNAGRFSQNYFVTQLSRMRESFYLFVKNDL
jgi:Exopolysaccharide biosynthesis protein YbjH